MSEIEARSESDQHLLERLRAGDEEAYRALFNHYSPEVLRTALRYLSTDDLDEVYEIVHLVFLKLFRRLDAIADSEELNLRVYLHRLTRSVCMDYLRSQYGRRKVVQVPLTEAASVPDPAEDLDERMDADRLVQVALQSVSERDRQIVQMRLNDASTSEISRILGISERAVRVRYLRAITYIRQAIERARIEERV